MNKEPIFEIELPIISKVISEDLILKYAEISGDFNLVHIDPVFAKNSVFGGIVAHGMMTLGFISNMLTVHFGIHWLKTGKLNVKFKIPARPGDKLATFGRIIQDDEDQCQRRIQCSISLINTVTNQKLIEGTATLQMPTTRRPNGDRFD
jgi:3-hydroxybutyryl-CoA dehydratase